MKLRLKRILLTAGILLISALAIANDQSPLVINAADDPSIVPVVKRAKTGANIEAMVEWSGIRDAIIDGARKHGLKTDGLRDLTVSIYVNGVEKVKNLPWETVSAKLKEPANVQVDYYIVYKRAGVPFHASHWNLHESMSVQTIDPRSFAGLYSGELFGFDLGRDLKRRNLSEELSRAAVRLGYSKVVWILRPRASAPTRAFIDGASHGVDIRLDFGKDGEPRSAEMTDRDSKKVLEAPVTDFYFKVDAAFNGNAFFWDDMLVAVATAVHHPWLAASTIRFWLMVQKQNGGVIPREVRKTNLLSFWFTDTYRVGERPRINLAYTNPYLMNWAMDVLYRFSPTEAHLSLMKEVSRSITQYAAWMERNRAVRAADGTFVGFNGSAIGAGLDNSRGTIGNFAEPAAYRRGFVDFLSQQVAMFKDLARWNQIFAEQAKNKEQKNSYLVASAESMRKATSLEHVLNDRYWNQEKGFYFDIMDDGKGGFVQDTKYVSIAGFWPLFARAADDAKLRRLIDLNMGPERFGGDFPLPANARNSIDPNAVIDYKPRTPYEDEDGYWDKWAHWPSMMTVAVEGFRRSGRPDVASDLAVKVLRKMAETSQTTVDESYGEVAETKTDGTRSFRSRLLQHDDHVTRTDFAGWGKLPPVYMMLVDVLGLDATYDGSLEWSVPSSLATGDRIGVKNLQFAGGTIQELSLARTADAFELSARSQRAVRIVVTDPATKTRQALVIEGTQKQRVPLAQPTVSK